MTSITTKQWTKDFGGLAGCRAQAAERDQIGWTKVAFEKLLHAVAQVHGCGTKDFTAEGRRRAWAKVRAQLADLARHEGT